jgi:hypothetical protein
VVKRFSQAEHLRRRLIESPASRTRESITWVSALLQKGHFIVGHQGSGIRNQNSGGVAHTGYLIPDH